MKKWLWLLIVAGWGAVSARAQVVVTKGAGQKTGLDLAAFQAAPTAGAATFRKTLQDDLARSGWFSLTAPGRGEVVLQGQCAESGGSINATIYVLHATTRQSFMSKSYPASSAEARRMAHRAADDIILAVTGRKGLNSGRLVLVGNRTKNKELYLCDADGAGLVQLTQDRRISLAPRWSPDGKTIVYTSYLRGYPDVYSIDVGSGARKIVANYPGLNTGGAVAPNGRDMALILSRTGNPELFVKSGGSLTRLTATAQAAEASPAWSPDGNRIVYVSDQAGTPQLYMISRSGGRGQRLTSRGSENVAPDWGANGWIAFSSKLGGRYQVCIMNPDTQEIRQITADGADYEDPSWAPDGRHIACARTVGYRSAIYLVDTMGDPPIPLLDASGDWFSPSWAP
ncbi:MAG: PD40 domain-containing protein [Kiritimatiellae bacterium]|nr:PD40 domain-containing protein [Kiritimatiellia bacterium]